MPGPSPVGFCKPCGACILTTCDKLKLYLKVTIDLNNCMFTLSKQSSSSTKELHGPHWISPFWPKTSKAAVMSRFVSGYYGDDLLWSGFIDIPGGRGKLGYWILWRPWEVIGHQEVLAFWSRCLNGMWIVPGMGRPEPGRSCRPSQIFNLQHITVTTVQAFGTWLFDLRELLNYYSQRTQHSEAHINSTQS